MHAVQDARLLAFGETLGIEVPTRYPRATHNVINVMIAADSTIMPLIFSMSRRTRLICQVLVALLMVGRTSRSETDWRRQLQAEITAGVFCLFAVAFGRIRFLERVYLLIGAVLLIANALMTQVSD